MGSATHVTEAARLLHDLNNALTVIAGYADLTGDDVDPEQRRLACSRLREAAREAQELARELTAELDEPGRPG